MRAEYVDNLFGFATSAERANELLARATESLSGVDIDWARALGRENDRWRLNPVQDVPTAVLDGEWQVVSSGGWGWSEHIVVSEGLTRVARQWAARCLAGALAPTLRWLPSERNPASAPSRRRVPIGVRLPFVCGADGAEGCRWPARGGAEVSHRRDCQSAVEELRELGADEPAGAGLAARRRRPTARTLRAALPTSARPPPQASARRVHAEQRQRLEATQAAPPVGRARLQQRSAPPLTLAKCELVWGRFLERRRLSGVPEATQRRERRAQGAPFEDLLGSWHALGMAEAHPPAPAVDGGGTARVLDGCWATAALVVLSFHCHFGPSEDFKLLLDPVPAIKVCVRVRPFNSREKELGAQLCVEIGQWEKDLVIVTNPKAPDQRKQFNFDRAYWSHNPSDPHFATQQTLMDEVGDELVEATLEGYNVCFFCYGQTGSGKTFSLLGNKDNSDIDDPNLRGMLPRVVERLFDRIAEITSGGSGSTITCTVQYYEIYNEAINDLLAKKVEGVEAKKLDVRYHPKTGVNIPGLSDLVASDRGAAMGALEQGMKTRAVSSTAMNAESSRSHCIFSMDVDQLIIKEDGSKKNLRSKVNFVDLAGSERQKKTGAQGDRLKEGVAINQSLSNLAVVISKLAELQGKEAKKGDFIPFRNSKLTFALMDSLSGSLKTKDRHDGRTVPFGGQLRRDTAVHLLRTEGEVDQNEVEEERDPRGRGGQGPQDRGSWRSSGRPRRAPPSPTSPTTCARRGRIGRQLQLVQDLLKKEETLKELRNSALQDTA
ncbi:unnamed protein product [Prorocentrum cordatum]|uniref:Kinesin-like protein n=1 Tax=Prorocentrum cordatum TaxID=2364126 RepID=A0ABN9XZZ3_9DINO|nr:unnamed protein product [Polarella glacialis]